MKENRKIWNRGRILKKKTFIDFLIFFQLNKYIIY